MKLLFFRSFVAMASAALVTACGGQATDAPAATAAMMQVVVAPAQGVAATAQVAKAETASVKSPTPDCAPENCAGLRIIDGNAEAYRIDAQRRAAAEANGDVPQA